MQTAHELMLHGMNAMLDGERQLVDALGTLEEDSTNPQLSKSFADHRRETEAQVERLQQCFEMLGESPADAECAGIRGLVEEKKVFMSQDPSPDILDIFQVGAAIKTESYEICEYESLIRMARKMKHARVAQLLGQNLKEEKAALRKMEGFSKKLKPEDMMNWEQQEKAKAASLKKPSRAA